MKVELELPKSYEKLFRDPTAKKIVKRALEQSLSEEFSKYLLTNLLKEIASKQTKISFEDFPKGKLKGKALKAVSEKVKEGIARRHGLI